MPKKKIITIAQRRDWLKAYEQGKTKWDLAGEYHYDVRTVGKALDQARREQIAGNAMSDLIKDSLRSHHNRMLSTISDFISVIEIPPVDHPLPWEGFLEPGYISMKGGKVLYDLEFKLKITGVSIEVETTPYWKLLEEHLKGDRIWVVYRRWKEQIGSYLLERILMKQKLAALLTEKTCLLLGEESDRSSFLYATSVDALTMQIMFRLPIIGNFKNSVYDIAVDEQRGDVKYGQGTILAHAPGKEQQCMEQILEALDEIKTTGETQSVISTFKTLHESTTELKDKAGELKLLGMIPGQCRICSRLGI